MNIKTMEGLTGASTNMKVLNTPLRVYKDAERRGDIAVMERAMGYVGEFAEKAVNYRNKAEKGMKEDAEEARERAETEREKVIQKRRQEREELEKRISESKECDTDTVEISDKGNAVPGEKSGSGQNGTDSGTSSEEKENAVELKPVIYTKTGEAAQSRPAANISVSV